MSTAAGPGPSVAVPRPDPPQFHELTSQLATSGLDLGYQSALFLLDGARGYLRDCVEAAVLISSFSVTGLDGAVTGERGLDVIIDWPALTTSPNLSDGEHIIVGTAWSLFRGGEGPGLGDITSVLDRPWIERCLEAARIRAGLSDTCTT